jgi:peptidoglycan hydrolase-like protein with peptidoglycan-binding domain
MSVNTYKRGQKLQLTEHFNISEFHCKGANCGCKETLHDPALSAYLQQIREHFGKPLKITSGYRCSSHNSAVGGASGSRHTKGQAADFTISGVAPLEIARYAELIGIKGIGLYDSFVHIDTRTRKSFWYSHAQQRRTTFGGAPEKDAYTLYAFIWNVQNAVGAMVDGIAGPETLSKTVTLSERKNRTHKAVLAVQKRLLALGYAEVGEADGIAGTKFTAAVTHFQKDNGCWTDGEITAKNQTWKKLLGMA